MADWNKSQTWGTRRDEKVKSVRRNIFRVGKYVYIFGRLKKSWLKKNWGHLGVRKWPRRGTTKKIQTGS